MLDLTKKYRTRDGREVRGLCVPPEREGSIYPIRGVIVGSGGFELWTDEGKTYFGSPGERGKDLIPVEEPTPATPPAFDPDKPVQTRDGRKARIVCKDRADTDRPLVVLVTTEDGREYVNTYDRNGGHCGGRLDPNASDLVNIPERETRYVNFYSYPELPSMASGFDTREAADQLQRVGRTAVLRITTENGIPVAVDIEKVER